MVFVGDPMVGIYFLLKEALRTTFMARSLSCVGHIMQENTSRNIADYVFTHCSRALICWEDDSFDATDGM